MRIRKQETLIPSGQKENCGCTINFMFTDDFQEKVYHHVFGNIVNITHTNMLCFVLLSSVKCKIYHTSLAKLHSILGLCFMPYISLYVRMCAIHRQNKVNFVQKMYNVYGKAMNRIHHFKSKDVEFKHLKNVMSMKSPSKSI